MTLPATGTQISMSQVNTELNVAAATQISLNDTAVRGLAGKTVNGSQIAMSDLQGKSGRISITGSGVTYASNSTNVTINVSTLSGYVAGKTDITITVNSGVYIYSTSTGTPALTITGAIAGDNVSLINNGYIIGMGGNGGYNSGVGFAGGPALSLGCNLTVTNNSYIAGGGGGGGGSWSGAGGGAGGGNGSRDNANASTAGTGGSPGNSGTNGATASGAGGGRILPGTGGAGALVNSLSSSVSVGGGAGGGGGAQGGQINQYQYVNSAGGGGGGWGAAGGKGRTAGGPAVGSGGGAGGTAGAIGGSGSGAGSGSLVLYDGGAGGAATIQNGYSLTWAATGTIYGAQT